MTILDKIKEKRIIQLDNEKSQLKQPSLIDALNKDGLQIIGEIKRASPSKGDIANTDFDINKQVEHYVAHGVAAFSILTENAFFKGQNEDLQFVRNKYPNIPILRKDFIFDPFQIMHAKLLGASAILLIVKMLSDEDLHELHKLAYDLGLEVLVEIHDEDELNRALLIPNLKLLGINNRNLNTFDTDLNTTKDLINKIPFESLKNITLISESGFLEKKDLDFAIEMNVSGILVGEALMKGKIYGE